MFDFSHSGGLEGTLNMRAMFSSNGGEVTSTAQLEPMT
jgi:hypothetical protein